MGFAADDGGRLVTLTGYGISPQAGSGVDRVEGFITPEEFTLLGQVVDICVGADREGFAGGIPPGAAGLSDRCVLFHRDGRIVAKGARFEVVLDPAKWVGDDFEDGASGTIIIVEASAFQFEPRV